MHDAQAADAEHLCYRDHDAVGRSVMGAPEVLGVKPRWLTRLADFIWTHQRVMPKIHYVGQFLPWHRLFLYEYERALREECLYFGGVPYNPRILSAAGPC